MYDIHIHITAEKTKSQSHLTVYELYETATKKTSNKIAFFSSLN